MKTQRHSDFILATDKYLADDIGDAACQTTLSCSRKWIPSPSPLGWSKTFPELFIFASILIRKPIV